GQAESPFGASAIEGESFNEGEGEIFSEGESFSEPGFLQALQASLESFSESESFSEPGLLQALQASLESFNEPRLAVGPLSNPLGIICGVVWYDENDNGLRDDLGLLGDAVGVEGVVVTLDGTDEFGAPVLETTTTDADGFYIFDALESGSYTLSFDRSDHDSLFAASLSYMWALANVDAPASDDFNSKLQGTPDRKSVLGSVDVVLDKAVALTNIDAGIVPYFHISGFVWDDENRDGTKDAGEDYLDGVKVSLFSDEGGSFAEVVSMLSGEGGVVGLFEFDGLLLVPELHYKLVFSNPDFAALRWSLPGGLDHTATELEGAHAENPHYFDEAHTASKKLNAHEEGWSAGLQEIPSFDVSFEPAGGAGGWGTSALFVAQVQAGSLLPYYEIDRFGYYFGGWIEEVSGFPWDFAAARMPERAVGLEARWLLSPSFDLRYHANGGTGAVPAAQLGYPSGLVVGVAVEPLPVREGFTFGGWALAPDSDEAVISVIIGAADVDLYAIWVAIPRFTVTYEPNGGLGAQADLNSYLEDTLIVLPGPGTVTRESHVFLGWGLVPEGPPVLDFRISGDTVVYAIWIEEVPIPLPPVVIPVETPPATGGNNTPPVGTPLVTPPTTPPPGTVDPPPGSTDPPQNPPGTTDPPPGSTDPPVVDPPPSPPNPPVGPNENPLGNRTDPKDSSRICFFVVSGGVLLIFLVVGLIARQRKKKRQLI
ncbi:MAG: InlB B-repeat-containing protein, partial [Eggerthellaceae bacterium]|nr:InlB B-repeat-containing protein [Eggerthellaceae bacterium]